LLHPTELHSPGAQGRVWPHWTPDWTGGRAQPWPRLPGRMETVPG
jgi:hypothetical protein